jgi:hypothetical protein
VQRTGVASLLACAVLVSPDGYSAHTNAPCTLGDVWECLGKAARGNLVLSEATL